MVRSEPAFHGPGGRLRRCGAEAGARWLPGPAGRPGGYYYLPPTGRLASESVTGRPGPGVPVALTVTVPPGCGQSGVSGGP